MRAVAAWEVGSPYLRAAVRRILLVYSMSLAISLGLVVLDERWVALIASTLSIAAVASAIEVTLRYSAHAGEPRNQPERAANTDIGLKWKVRTSK